MEGNKVSIIILTFNNLHYTVDCINSIRTFTKDEDYEIIIVDNNSTDGTREWLKEQTDIKYILNDSNEGFPKGVNIGIDYTHGSTDVLMLNNDTIVTPNWLKNLKKALYSSEDVGAVGAVSNCVANQQDIQVSYKDSEEMIDFAMERSQLYEGVWELKHLLIGFCFLIKREVINRVGVLDELYTPGNYEDCDYSLRIIEEGYRLLLCHDVFIHHAGSATFRAFPEIYSFFGANRAKFDKKWGWDHSLVADVRLDLIGMIDEKRPLNILEVGCGSGMNLIKLKFKNNEYEVYGIEEVEGVSKIAEKLLGKPVYHKIEEYPYDYNENYFDYIIIGDLLAYLDSPVKFLSYIKTLLKADGKILLSFKNLSSIKNIKEILNNGVFHQFEVEMAEYKKRIKNLYMLKDVYNIFAKANIKSLYTTYVVEPLTLGEEDLIEDLRGFTAFDESANYRAKSYYILAGK